MEDDSGFESLVTNVSDSGSVSSRLVMTSPANKEFMSVDVSEPAYQNIRSKKSFVSQDKYRTEVGKVRNNNSYILVLPDLSYKLVINTQI